MNKSWPTAKTDNSKDRHSICPSSRHITCGAQMEMTRVIYTYLEPV